MGIDSKTTMHITCNNQDILNLIDIKSIKQQNCSFLTDDLHDFITLKTQYLASLESEKDFQTWIKSRWCGRYLTFKNRLLSTQSKKRASFQADWLNSVV